MCACQALEFVDKIPENFLEFHKTIRNIVPDCKNQDILMSTYMNKLANEIRMGNLDNLKIWLNK